MSKKRKPVPSSQLESKGTLVSASVDLRSVQVNVPANEVIDTCEALKEVLLNDYYRKFLRENTSDGDE